MKQSESDLDFLDETLRLCLKIKRSIQAVARRNPAAGNELHLSYFFFAKAVTSLGAVRVLWAKGFFQDALMLTRSIFEACAQDLYIRTDRTRLSARYLAYDPIARHRLCVGMIRSAEGASRTSLRVWKDGARRYGRAEKYAPYEYEQRGWSGKSLSEIVRLLKKKRYQGIWGDYEFFYTLSSAVSHSSPLSIQEYMRRPFRTSYRQLSHRRPYLRKLPVLACYYCLRIGHCCAHDHYHLLEKTDALAGVLFEGYHLLRTLVEELER